QVDYHLKRARSAAATRMPGARTTVLPIVQGLVRAMQRIHADRQLEFTVGPIADELAFHGEEQDLQEMLGNLLENACKWARRRVELEAKREDGRLRIAIDDDGKGIARERRQEILRRGARADEQVEGSGLGLPIVAEPETHRNHRLSGRAASFQVARPRNAGAIGGGDYPAHAEAG